MSRRDLLRKAAVAGGIVWTAPVVMSITTQAAAAGSPAPSTTTTTPITVVGLCNQESSFKFCGDVVTTCGGQEDCFCVQTTEGNFACATDLDDACASPGPPLCKSSSDCPPREPICITVDNCCGDGFGRCVQLCPGMRPGTYKPSKDVRTPLG